MSEKQDTQIKLKTGTIYHNDGEQLLINALLDLQTKEAEVLDIQRQIQDHIRIIEHLKLDLKNKESAIQNSRVNLRNILYFYGQDLDNLIKNEHNGSITRKQVDDKVAEWKEVPMLAKTHGQPASPTRLGKEIKVFTYRLTRQLELLKKVAISGKFGGATGNFNAHNIAFPEIDWAEFGNKFLNEKLSIERESYTTQISNYDNFAALFDNLRRINNIIIDLDRDFWTYISMTYFKQKIKAGEVGSSAMPHKVNPIDFENSEGNLGIANAIFEHLSDKLPISRLQRDLTDSTVLRNIGVPLAHTIIAVKSTLKGLNKLIINQESIEKDLDKNWAVVAEAIQTVLRREGYPNPYEALKALTRTNNKITQESIAEFIDTLEISDGLKQQLKQITPSNYTGI